MNHLAQCNRHACLSQVDNLNACRREGLNLDDPPIRRPPAQRRITYIGKRTVTFWYKDKKLHRKVYMQYSLEEFIDRWAQHIPERYQHAARSFGLFASRSLKQTSAAIFVILGQERRPRPKPRRWADSLKRDFGHDPLLDQTGKRMKWVRRLAPKASC
jgi:hypothetical protein